MTARVVGLALLLGGVPVLFGAPPDEADGCGRVYVVSPVEASPPRIDGVLAGDEWPAGGWESDLTFPWRDEAAPETAFIARAGDGALYFAFRVRDDDVVVVDGSPDDESLVARGDRVELFFARDPELGEYYSIEIDPRARVLDYRARSYRQFDDRWDSPGLEVAARQRPGGYDVEGRLSRRALEAMGVPLSSDRPMLAGVFRGEFSRRGDGEITESWISWVRPRVPEPDFHVPSAFGCFRLEATPSVRRDSTPRPARTSASSESLPRSGSARAGARGSRASAGGT